jgi:WhiB family redox-sensing transcriptional regulator
MIDPAYLPPAWTKEARCAEVDTEIFFPDKGDSASAEAARRICNGCEVKTECLEYALDNREMYGIWGGTNERDRRPLLKARGIAC